MKKTTSKFQKRMVLLTLLTKQGLDFISDIFFHKNSHLFSKVDIMALWL